MYDDDYAFDGEVGENIEVLIVHDEDQSISNSKQYSPMHWILSYEEICEKINEEEKMRNNLHFNFNYKERLIRDVILIILMVIIYIFTNPFTNGESSDPIWRIVLYFIICSISFIGFFLNLRAFKKDWRIFKLYKDKKWYEEKQVLSTKEVD